MKNEQLLTVYNFPTSLTHVDIIHSFTIWQLHLIMSDIHLPICLSTHPPLYAVHRIDQIGICELLLFIVYMCCIYVIMVKVVSVFTLETSIFVA